MIYNILYSNKEFGGAEIYVRKMQQELGISFFTLKGAGVFEWFKLLYKLINPTNTFIFHDSRASVLCLIRVFFHKDFLVLHGPGKHPKSNYKVFKFLSLFCKRVILVNEFIFDKLPNNKFAVIENESSLVSKASYVTHDAIYFGRIEASKGVDKLCAAWDKICTKGKLHIVGDGTLLEALKKDYGQKNIIFYGSKTHQEIEKVIQLCAFYISLSPREGKSLSLQEALSTGLIPIVTNIPSQSYLTSELGLRLIEANLDNCEDVLSFYNESSIKVRSALGKIVKEYNKQKPCSHWKASWVKTLNL
jgi:glycosyltransferase involved in cell wall biosynthesis